MLQAFHLPLGGCPAFLFAPCCLSLLGKGSSDVQGCIYSRSFLLLENKFFWVCSSFLEAHVKPIE